MANTKDVLVKAGNRRTEHGMVIGAAGLVPILGQGGKTKLMPIAKAVRLGGGHKSERKVAFTNIEELARDYLGAEDTGIVIAELVIVTDEFITRVLRAKTNIKGKSVSALRICAVAVITVKIVEIEFVDRLFKSDDLLLKCGDVLFPADGACDLDKPCKRNDVEIGVDKGCWQGPLLGRAPVTKTPAALFVACYNAGLAMILEALNKLKHLGVVIKERLFVAVEFIELVRNGYDGDSPSTRAAAAGEEG